MTVNSIENELENGIENGQEEGKISVSLGKEDATFLHQISATLEHMLNIEMPMGEILSKIIESFKQDNTYVSFVSVSQKVQLSLAEINRLTSFSMKEKKALEYMLASHRRNPRIRTLLENLEREVQEAEGTSEELSGCHFTVDELWRELMGEYDIRFRNQQLRRGIKKLIIKSVIISGVNLNKRF